MRTLPLVALLLGACATMDQHRTTCAAMLGRPAILSDVPGGPVTSDAKPDPAVESCAVRRADAERAAVGLTVVGLLAVGVLGAAVAAGPRSTPSYRSSYHPRYRR